MLKTSMIAGLIAVVCSTACAEGNLKHQPKKDPSTMKTVRLLYPDFVSGGLEEYAFGANLLQHILPQNNRQPLLRVPLKGPDGRTFTATDGITGREEVEFGITKARELLDESKADKVITIGGNCLVSLAPFDYLHGKYENLGILWIDAHPDVSTPKDGYLYAHAMVLGALLGNTESGLDKQMKAKPFKSSDLLYVGLQGLHDYQRKFLDDAGVTYRVQDKSFVSDEEITSFVKRFDHVLVHFDIDVLDEHFFHSTYFANPNAGGDGAGGGKMTMDKLSSVLQLISREANVVGFTIAEYLPFDEFRLHKMLKKIDLFTE